MSLFTETTPTLDAYWRSIILFGDNVASYKFALAQSLLELAATGQTTVRLDELAIPFARAITTHLALENRQTTSLSSRFLDACRAYNRCEIDHDKLIAATVRHGFTHVIDAFHTVNRAPIPMRFFIDQGRRRGITLTDDLLLMREQIQFVNLPVEVEARWRLVETAWGLRLPVNLVVVAYDAESRNLIIDGQAERRITVTASRDALNGYQKGRCFYCFDEITVTEGPRLADVDHFFPHMLARFLPQFNFNGIWNLVLACQNCNRGEETVGGKFARVPSLRYLERLHRRNTYLIESHHPLRETIINQTGVTEDQRQAFLSRVDSAALERLIHRWQPPFEHQGAFPEWRNDRAIL